MNWAVSLVTLLIPLAVVASPRVVTIGEYNSATETLLVEIAKQDFIVGAAVASEVSTIQGTVLDGQVDPQLAVLSKRAVDEYQNGESQKAYATASSLLESQVNVANAIDPAAAVSLQTARLAYVAAALKIGKEAVATRVMNEFLLRDVMGEGPGNDWPPSVRKFHDETQRGLKKKRTLKVVAAESRQILVNGIPVGTGVASALLFSGLHHISVEGTSRVWSVTLSEQDHSLQIPIDLVEAVPVADGWWRTKGLVNPASLAVSLSLQFADGVVLITSENRKAYAAKNGKLVFSRKLMSTSQDVANLSKQFSGNQLIAQENESSHRKWKWIAGGLGAAATATGGILLGIHFSDKNSTNRSREEKNLLVPGTAAVGVGVGLLVTSYIMFRNERKAEDKTAFSLSPLVGESTGVVLSGRF